MSASHITWKEVNRRYAHVIDGGNGRWQYLQSVCRWDRVWYNAGTNGWNYDVYHVMPGVCLVDGYRQPDGNLPVDEDRMRRYDDEARAILGLYPSEYKARRPAFVRKVMHYIRNAAEAADARGAGGRPPARH